VKNRSTFAEFIVRRRHDNWTQIDCHRADTWPGAER